MLMVKSAGALIRHKRTEAGLSMSEVARRADMLLTRLWKIEHGEYYLRAEDVTKIARAIGCDPRDLLPADHAALAPMATAEEGTP